MLFYFMCLNKTRMFKLPVHSWEYGGRSSCVIYKWFPVAGILEDRDEKNKGGALFFREYGRTASYYANRTFEPIFESTPELIIPANRTADIQKANELCGDSYQCKYDYSVSLNRDLAFYTLQYQDGFVNTKKMSKQRGERTSLIWKYICILKYTTVGTRVVLRFWRLVVSFSLF